MTEPTRNSVEVTAPLENGSQHISLLHAWLGVAVLWLFYVLSFMDRGIIALMVTPIMKDLGLTPVQIGVLQGFAFAVVYSIAALPLGWAIDRVSRRMILFGGVVVWSGGTLACGFADGFTQIITARACVGLGEAMLVPAALSLIADMFPRHRIATATAVFSSGATFGAGSVLILGGSLLNHLERHDLPSMLDNVPPWRLVFLLFGSVGLLVACLSVFVPDARSRARAANVSVPRQTTLAGWPEFGQFVSKHMLLLMFLFLSFPLMGASMNAFLAWAPHHFEQAFGWNLQKVGLVLGTMKLIAPPLGVVCGGLVIDKALRAGVPAPHFLIPMICAIIGGPLQAAGLMQSDPVWAIVLVTLGQFTFSAYGSAQYSVLQLLAPPSLRGRLSALYLMVISLISPGLGALLPPVIDTFSSTGHGSIGRATGTAILIISALAAIVLALGRGKLHAALIEANGSKGS